MRNPSTWEAEVISHIRGQPALCGHTCCAQREKQGEGKNGEMGWSGGRETGVKTEEVNEGEEEVGDDGETEAELRGGEISDFESNGSPVLTFALLDTVMYKTNREKIGKEK